MARTLVRHLVGTAAVVALGSGAVLGIAPLASAAPASTADAATAVSSQCVAELDGALSDARLTLQLDKAGESATSAADRSSDGSQADVAAHDAENLLLTNACGPFENATDSQDVFVAEIDLAKGASAADDSTFGESALDVNTSITLITAVQSDLGVS